MSPDPLRLMAILAHPDDESLGLGGALAKYASQGVELSLVTATRGEGGRYLTHRDGPDHPGPERLGAIREAELRAAAEVLGVRDLALLGFLDGRLDRVDPREAIARIVHHVRRVRPQVVVTFPPDGAYGHPDHIAISQFTTAAMVAAADAGYRSGAASDAPHAVSKLYYFVANQAEWEAYQTAFKKLVSVVDGVERLATPWPEWSITTVVDTRSHWRLAWQAVSCHVSQIANYRGLRDLPPERHEALWGVRRFYRAYSTVNGGRQLETDLFEGLRDTTG
jgi:LmbE family N-acetylglucosaminyl deacetylase